MCVLMRMSVALSLSVFAVLQSITFVSGFFQICPGNDVTHRLHAPCISINAHRMLSFKNPVKKANHCSLRMQKAEESIDAETILLPSRLYELESELRGAVQTEDYTRAARLRDQVKSFRKQDAVANALDSLQNAVTEEDFDRAVAIRDDLACAVQRRSHKTTPCSVNRLLVLTRDGGLFTCNPDGTAIAKLSDEADRGRIQYFQPTWNPSGDLVAATRLDLRRGGGDASSSDVVVMWTLDGSTLMSVEAPFVPFYISWSFSSQRVTYLTAHMDGRISRGVGLDLFQVFSSSGSAQSGRDARSVSPLLDGGRVVHLEDGVPLYYTHCPRDNRIAMHVGDKFRVSVVNPAALGGEEVILSTRPGAFRAPQWMPQPASDGTEMVLFVEGAPDAGAPDTMLLVLADAAGGGPRRRRVLAKTAGFCALSVSPDGQRIALLSRRSRLIQEELRVLEGPFDLEPDPWPTDARRIDIDTTTAAAAGVEGGAGPLLGGERRRVLGFFWSPDGGRLLILTGPERDPFFGAGGGEGGAGAAAGGEAPALRWEVLDALTGRMTRFEPFQPSGTMLSSYLPFFDQYSQSVRLWAPDGKSFCYTGRAAPSPEGDREGAFVQRVPPRGAATGPPPPPELVAPGAELVFWSPR